MLIAPLAPACRAARDLRLGDLARSHESADATLRQLIADRPHTLASLGAVGGGRAAVSEVITGAGMTDGSADGACLRSWEKACTERDGCRCERTALGNVKTH